MNDSVQTYLPTHHGRNCRHSGFTFEEASPNLEDCCCDPDGYKAQRMLDWKRKWDRAHVLYQKKVWYNSWDNEIRLKDMSLRYKKNVLNFLERRAYKHYTRTYSQMASFAMSLGGDMAIDAAESMMYEHEDKDPLEWLHETPFVKRLVKLIDKGQDGPID